MTTAKTTCSPTDSGWNERIINLLIALGSGHSIRVSGASSLMIHERKELAAEIQFGRSAITVAVWLTVRIGSDAESLDDPELRRRGEAALEDIHPTWDERGFARSKDEYLDRLNPDDPVVVFVARLDAEVDDFDEAVELVHWALNHDRNLDVLEGHMDTSETLCALQHRLGPEFVVNAYAGSITDTDTATVAHVDLEDGNVIGLLTVIIYGHSDSPQDRLREIAREAVEDRSDELNEQGWAVIDEGTVTSSPDGWDEEFVVFEISHPVEGLDETVEAIHVLAERHFEFEV